MDENNCYICSLELRYGVMVALQILVLSAQVRILVPQLCSAKLSLLRKRTISTPVTIDTGHIPGPLRLLRKRAISTPVCCRRQPLSGASRLRQASAGRLRCFDVCDISLTLRRAACAAPAALKSLSDFAGAKSRDRADALMSTL